MDFIEELTWRNMLHDITPGAEEKLSEGKMIGYIGFDPTAPSLTIGNYVQLMLLKFFQLSGHQPIILMGGATGRVGDPSGKDKERVLKSASELDRNLEFQKAQAMKFLDFEGENKALVVNNFDFYKEMNVLDFLRDVGKTVTVNYMMSKDSVKNRLETGLSFTEFSYQLLQAYDFQCLYTDFGCNFQMGGSDQWGNITSGTEFIRKNTDGKAFAITTPLLTKSDGSKFGKSSDGNLWLDPTLTSPYQFYQFWINSDDNDLPKFFRYFSLRTKEEIEALEEEYKENPNQLKSILAEEITTRVHSAESCLAAKEVSGLLFNRNANKDQLYALSVESLTTVSEEITSFNIEKNIITSGIQIGDLISEIIPIVTSKGEARKAIKNNAIAVNKTKISSHEFMVTGDHLLHDKFIMIENGKKNKYMILATDK